MKAEQLRKSILQLAIQGKLVPQDPNDEPASVLLERIRAEKQRLIKEGKIKKDKNDSVIFKGDDNRHYEKVGSQVKDITDDLPFEIPDSWVWCRLNDIASISAGGTPERHNPRFWANGTIPWLKISDITSANKYIKQASEYITEEGLKNSSAKILPKGTLLYTIFATIGEVGILDFDASCNQAIAGVQLFNTAIRDYLYYYLINLQAFMMSISKGCAQFNINQKILKAVFVPLPPLAEQVRIVAKIEKFEPLIAEYDKLEQQATKLDEEIYDKLKKSILQYAIQGKLVPQDPNDEPASVLLERIRAEKKAKLGKKYVDSYIYKGDDNCYYEKVGTNEPVCLDNLPFDIPDSWCWARLGTIGDWGAGATPARTNSQYYGGNIPWLKTGELNNDTVYDSEEHITDDALKNCSLRYCQIGDILIAMYGATIGKLAIAGVPLTTNQACCACTPYEGIYNLYLFYFLMEEKDNFTQMGFGGAQPNISKEKIVKHLFPVPPYEEQKRIVSTFIDIQNKLKDEA